MRGIYKALAAGDWLNTIRHTASEYVRSTSPVDKRQEVTTRKTKTCGSQARIAGGYLLSLRGDQVH